MAKYKVDQDTSGRYLVTYVPVEAGQYDVNIKWNGYEIEGSPFHPRVMNLNMVIPVGGWEQLLSAQGKISLTANQTRRIDFDTSRAGDGQMTAEVRGPGGNVPVSMEGFGGQHSVIFTPQAEGDYYLTVWWNEVQLPRCPLVATTQGGGFYSNTNTMEQQQQQYQQQYQPQYQQPIVVDTMVKQQAQQVMTTSQVSSVNHEKVVLMGRGLTGAQVHEEAEFVIDGTDAGPGVPSVKLTGVTTDIDIHVTPVGINKYRCTYVPIMPGAYLLSITWSDRQVRGSPFKVSICASSDASKVDCSGDGLKTGIMGREIKSTIDARQAGPGELTAHCTGPTKVAFCQLFDHHDGTFTLTIKPQEPGRHILQVKYGGDHVPGSPFELKVSGAPDASKVKVTGPGVEHGILATFRSHFICETRGAGAGQLTVRVRGPKGAFRVEMQRESQRDRTILCRYDPTEVGEYSVHVRWSDKDVPGSPFNVRIFDTKEELDRALATLRHRRPDAANMTMASMTWHDDDM
ncbi:hypothetical protein NP493_968g02016 [Ridgeia piscesae]|uniref:Uncharacterized protein n=1 Tax=Ridgeia piscesae TaxID=27915 RepID=A0AAD9NJI7_RIDPI|nr:hypothetical protein NP493_968g02016 [Ridgeia piscesae]